MYVCERERNQGEGWVACIMSDVRALTTLYGGTWRGREREREEGADAIHPLKCLWPFHGPVPITLTSPLFYSSFRSSFFHIMYVYRREC